MIRTLLAAALFALAATAAQAAEIYAGTIGQAQVVVMLRHQGHEVQGTYAYRSPGRYLTLSGPEGGSILNLTEQVFGESPESRPTGHWRLTRQGDGWTGTWRAIPNGPARTITLRRIATSEVDGPMPEGWVSQNVGSSGFAAAPGIERRPFLLELARAPVTLGPTQTIGAGAFQMATDPRTGVSWPRFTRLVDAATLARVNAVFEENRAIAIDDMQDCRSAMPGAPVHSDTAPKATVTFVGRRLIGLAVDGSMDCGGAPNAFHHVIHYDVRTARPFDASTLLRPGDGERARFEAFWIPRLQAMEAANRRGDCFEIDSASPPRVAYRVTATGLIIELAQEGSFDLPCAQPLLEIPLAELTPFLADGARANWD